MKKLIVVSIVALSILSIGGCKNKEIQSNWAVKAISVSGDTAEWDNIPMQLFENPDIDLRLSNNADNLFVMVGFSDQNLVRMFHMTGITLWFDKSLKKKKDFGIRYRGGFPARNKDENFPPEEREKPSRPPERKERKEGISIVTKDGNEISLPLSSYGPSGALSFTDGLCRVKFVIPLKKTDTTPYALDIFPGAKFSLGFETGKMSQEDKENMRERRGGMRGEGGRGGDGGGMGDRGGIGGGMGGGMGGRRGGMGRPGGMEGPGNMQNTDLWVTVTAANDNPK